MSGPFVLRSVLSTTALRMSTIAAFPTLSAGKGTFFWRLANCFHPESAALFDRKRMHCSLDVCSDIMTASAISTLSDRSFASPPALCR